MKRFIVAMHEAWKEWKPLVLSLGALALLTLLPGLVIYYFQTHRSVEIEPGLSVTFAADAAYMKHAPGGWSHQFWGEEQKASFTIRNDGETVKYVYVRALCGWQIPIAGHLRLEPGEKTTISLKFKHDWWFWLEPESQVEAMARR